MDRLETPPVWSPRADRKSESKLKLDVRWLALSEFEIVEGLQLISSCSTSGVLRASLNRSAG